MQASKAHLVRRDRKHGEDIADPCYFWPRNFGSSFLYVVREMTTRFGNDFNSALNQPALFPILFESFKSHTIQYATNAFDRFNDISETGRVFLTGDADCCASFSLAAEDAGGTLLHVHQLEQTELAFFMIKKRSTSESRPASSRAVEPNI